MEGGGGGWRGEGEGGGVRGGGIETQRGSSPLTHSSHSDYHMAVM